MSTATLTFKLPAESAEFAAASNAGKLVSLVEDWGRFLREKVKYGNQVPKSWEEVREEWFFYLEDAAIPEGVRP